MMKLKIFLSVVLVLAVSSTAYADEYISSCDPVEYSMMIASSATTYRLTQDVSADDSCFYISYRSDVVLDCQGHTISYLNNPTGWSNLAGIYVSSSNDVTIRNCIITTSNAAEQSEAISAGGTVDRLTVENASLSTAAYQSHGLGLHGVNGSYFANITITTKGTGSHGVFSYPLSNTTFKNLSIATEGSGSHGMRFESCEGCLFSYNIDVNDTKIYTTGAGSYGINSLSLNNSKLNNITINTTGEDSPGVYFAFSANNTFDKIKVDTNGTRSEGVNLTNSSLNTAGDLDIHTGGAVAPGVSLYGSNSNTIRELKANTTWGSSDGIFLWSSDYNIFETLNMSTRGSTSRGIYSQHSNNNKFRDVKIATGINAINAHAMYFLSSVSNNISDVVTSTDRGYGIFAMSSNNSIFHNMSISTSHSTALGISLRSSSGNNLSKVSVSGQYYYVSFYVAENNTMRDFYFGPTSTRQVYVSASLETDISGNNFLLNMTNLLRSGMTFVSANPTTAMNITLQWYMRVNVTDGSHNPISGASVTYADNFSVAQGSGTTGANGLTGWFVANDTTYRPPVLLGANISYNNHLVTVSKTGYETKTVEANITDNTQVDVVLSPVSTGYSRFNITALVRKNDAVKTPCIGCAVVVTFPYPGGGTATADTNSTGDFSATVEGSFTTGTYNVMVAITPPAGQTTILKREVTIS